MNHTTPSTREEILRTCEVIIEHHKAAFRDMQHAIGSREYQLATNVKRLLSPKTSEKTYVFMDEFPYIDSALRGAIAIDASPEFRIELRELVRRYELNTLIEQQGELSTDHADISEAAIGIAIFYLKRKEPDKALEALEGYRAKLLALTRIVQQQGRQESTKLASVLDTVSVAYGYLWHVNNEPGTPYQYPPEQAAYVARRLLRDLLTHEQRGNGINEVMQRMSPNQCPDKGEVTG